MQRALQWFFLGFICIVSVHSVFGSSVYDVFDTDSSSWNTTTLENWVSIDLPSGWEITLPGKVDTNVSIYKGSGINDIATLNLIAVPYSDPDYFSRVSELDNLVSYLISPSGMVLDESSKYSYSTTDDEHYFSYSFRPKGKKSGMGHSIAYIREKKGCGAVLITIEFSQEETFTQSLQLTKMIADSVKFCENVKAPGKDENGVQVSPQGEDDQNHIVNNENGANIDNSGSEFKTLQVQVKPDTVAAGEDFSLIVSGNPGKEYNLWVTDVQNSWPHPPRIVREQEGVTQDDPDGPYQIGSYQYQNGESKSVRDVMVDDLTSHGTDFYAKVLIPKDGEMSVQFRTDTYMTKKGTYSIRVESVSQTDKKTVFGEVKII